MRYKLKNIAALDIALGSLPNRTRVEVDPGIDVSAKTVGQLRKVTVWPENLAITTPHGGDVGGRSEGEPRKCGSPHITKAVGAG